MATATPRTSINCKGVRVAIVDDDAALGRALALHLEEQGFVVDIYCDGAVALKELRRSPADIVFLDVHLTDMSGFDVLREARKLFAQTYFLMITAFHDMETTVEATKLGAFDYIVKPLDIDRVDDAVQRALAHRLETRDAVQVVATRTTDQIHRSVVASTPGMLEIFKTIGRVAPSAATVLIEGESGTGKELVARAIHQFSDRPGPFLSVNCAMLSEEFLASELFGHEAGSFTGAKTRKLGKFELANDGTVLLDEAAELSIKLQARLLRFLQEREFERLGGSETISTDVRVIAATNRSLEEMTKRRLFREDLYYRLNVVSIHVPPLRERRDDIPVLVQHLLGRLSRTLGKAVVGVDQEAMERLYAYSWPGNVRELENVLVRAIVQAQGEMLLASELPKLGETQRVSADASETELGSLSDVERKHILHVLQHCAGQKRRAAAILGISRPTLDKKLSRYGIDIRRVAGDISSPPTSAIPRDRE